MFCVIKWKGIQKGKNTQQTNKPFIEFDARKIWAHFSTFHEKKNHKTFRDI